MMKGVTVWNPDWTAVLKDLDANVSHLARRHGQLMVDTTMGRDAVAAPALAGGSAIGAATASASMMSRSPIAATRSLPISR